MKLLVYDPLKKLVLKLQTLAAAETLFTSLFLGVR
jgi:hypothetical protein